MTGGAGGFSPGLEKRKREAYSRTLPPFQLDQKNQGDRKEKREAWRSLWNKACSRRRRTGQFKEIAGCISKLDATTEVEVKLLVTLVVRKALRILEKVRGRKKRHFRGYRRERVEGTKHV